MTLRFGLMLLLGLCALTTSGCTYRRSFMRASATSIPQIESAVERTLVAQGYTGIRHKNKGKHEVKEGETIAQLPAGPDGTAGVTARFLYKLRRDGVEVQMRVRGETKEHATKIGQPLGKAIESMLAGVPREAVVVQGPPPISTPRVNPGGLTANTPRNVTPDPAAALPPATGQKHCLIVGVSRYRGDFADLTAARRDAEEIRRGFEAMGVPASNLHLLVDRDAKNSRIIQLLTEIADKAGSGDTIVVYYAGHGRAPDSEDRYLVPYDGVNDERHGTMIPIKTLESILNSSQAERQLVLLDCCFVEPSSRGAVADNAFEPLQGPGRVVITSAKGSQKALDVGSDGIHSPFARALLDVFKDAKSADFDGNQQVTADELHRAIQNPVAAEAGKAGINMNPQIYGAAAPAIPLIEVK